MDFTVLSLFSGYGGLELALKSVWPRTRVVGYVERESYAASVLLARMEDSSLEPAPIWCGDFQELPLAPFQGVDIITAGFPCQPWSSAGKRRGMEDERWLWDGIADIIRQLRPKLVFLENVPGLALHHGLEAVLGSLAALGYDAEWTVLPASAVGAPHKRERLFILANASFTERGDAQQSRLAQAGWAAAEPGECGGKDAVANARSARRPEVARSALGDEGAHEGWPTQKGDEPGSDGQNVAHRDWGGRQGDGRGPFPPGPDDREWDELLEATPGAQPALCRDVDGAADWLGTAHASTNDQLRLLGNGVVPQQATAALRILLERARCQAEDTEELAV